ncbi:hypothetical protein HYW18_02370 [Candidatus Uhrbacteria bacterium]|nr:hypothetical protein [Candidatus Uhrbacteria bacterium]
MKNLPLFLVSFVLSLLALPAFAEEPDRYADTVVEGQNFFLSSEAALGAPDNVFSDNMSGGGSLKLDLGRGEEGLGNLTLHYAVFSPQVQVIVDLLDANGNLLLSQGNYAPIANSWVFEYSGTTPYRYVVIYNTGRLTLRIDAVEAAQVVSSGETVEQESTEPVEVVTQDPLRGRIVKLVDDWNDATDTDKIVYMLDARNNRHVIPNEAVFDSWSLEFSGTEYVGAGSYTAMPLTQNVYVRPGTYLVKIQASPKVYAVATGGVLRWIHTEEIAEKLYGKNWAQRVIDVPEVLFARYTKGEPITRVRYPGTSYVRDEFGSTWYVSDTGRRWSVGPKTLEALKLKEGFLETGMTLTEFSAEHEFAERLPYSDGLRWPF